MLPTPKRNFPDSLPVVNSGRKRGTFMIEKELEKLIELGQQETEEMGDLLGGYEKGSISEKELNSKIKLYDKSYKVQNKILQAIKEGADDKEIKGLYDQIKELRKKLEI
jgi:tryptophanyl-tRNA synthetase